MYVQDVVMPGLNIAAEIPKQEAMNFKAMCKMFSSHKPTNNNKSIDIPKVVVTRSTGIEQVANVFSLIDKEIGKACNSSRLESREGFEEEIVSILTEYLTGPKAVLEIIPFGSSRYGFKRPYTNFNLLINTSTFKTSFFIILLSFQKYLIFCVDGQKPLEISQQFQSDFTKNDIHRHFKDIKYIGNEIKMTHSESGVQCVLLFQKDETILHSTEILNQYFNRYPMCMARLLFQYIFCLKPFIQTSTLMHFRLFFDFIHLCLANSFKEFGRGKI